MYVSKIWLDLHLIGNPSSLKEKRQIIRSLIDRLKNKFNISVAEVGVNDLLQRAEIGISYVTTDGKIAENIKTKIVEIVDSQHNIETIDIFSETEKLK